MKLLDKIGGDRKRTITLLLMKDMVSEPVQYRINARKLRIGIAAGSVMAVVVVCLFALYFPVKLIRIQNELKNALDANRELERYASTYRVSDEELKALHARVGELEGILSMSSQRTQVLISGLEREIKYWVPDDAVGGGERDMPADILNKPLSPSQLVEVKKLETRLNRLDSRLDSFDLTLDEVERSWKKLDSVFASLPSSWPLAKGRITSKFGRRRHPITQKYVMHEGIDISAPLADPVYATAPGVVTFAGWRTGYGRAIIIDHGYGLSTFYAHCRQLMISVGDKVEMGQKIGLVGSSGYSTGPHLHFEVRVNGMQVDPLQYLSIYSPKPGD